MALEITVLQGVDVFAQMFNAVAAFVRNETWHSLMIIAEIIGVVASMVVYIKKRDLKVMGLWLLSFILINTLLLTPKERLVITELQTSKVRTVDNVPLGVALPIYFTTLVGNAIARSYDTLLAQPEDIQYSRTGLLFGQRLMDHSMGITPNEPNISSNLNNYMKFCLIERNVISKEFAWTALLQSSDLKEYLQKGKTGDMINYTNDRGEVSSKNCEEAGKQIQNDINASMNASRKGVAWDFARKLGIDGMLNGLTIPQLNSKMAAVQNYFMGTSKSASDIYVQNMLVNQFRKSIDSYPTQLDASAVLISQTAEQSLTKMKLSHLSSYQVSGRLLPALHTTLLALMVGLFPVMVLAMFIRELAWGVVKNYLAVLFSLMMWPVMFAIFNSIMNTLLYQTLNGQSFTLSNANTLKENASTMAGVAMWLTASIPFLSFRLVTSLGQSIASAGSYLGNAMVGATTADAAQTAQGNYNWGNMSTNNVNGNKVDLNHSWKSGASMIQNSMGGMEITNPDGTQSYDAGTSLSKLPFSVNWVQSIQSSWNERTAMTISQDARNSQGVRESITNALSHLTGYNSGHTHSTMSGRDWADNDGINKNIVAGQDTISNENNSSSKNFSTGFNAGDQTRVNTGVSVSPSLGGFGGASLSGSTESSNGSSSSDNYASAIARQIEDRFNSGESFAKLDGYIESIKGGVTDTNFLTTLSNVQKDLRQANERYNDYVETESKSLNQTKEAVLSETRSDNVNHDLNSALYRHIKSNYSGEEQAKILSSDPTKEGMELRQKAIGEISVRHIDNVVGKYQSDSKGLVDNYQGTHIRNTAGSAPSDIGVSPNQSIMPPKVTSNENSQGSGKKERLDREFKNAQSESQEMAYKTRSHNAMMTKQIEEQSKEVGEMAKGAENKAKSVVDWFKK